MTEPAREPPGLSGAQRQSLNVLPYGREDLFPLPPKVEVARGLGNFAIALAVFAWSAAIGLITAKQAAVALANTTVGLGMCGGGLAWMISIGIGVGVMWRREIRGLIAVLLDVSLIVGMWLVQ